MPALLLLPDPELPKEDLPEEPEEWEEGLEQPKLLLLEELPKELRGDELLEDELLEEELREELLEDERDELLWLEWLELE